MYISLLSLPSLPLSLSLDCLHLKILDPQESRKPNRFIERLRNKLMQITSGLRTCTNLSHFNKKLDLFESYNEKMLYRKADYIASYKKGYHMKTDRLNPVFTITKPSRKITQQF